MRAGNLRTCACHPCLGLGGRLLGIRPVAHDLSALAEALLQDGLHEVRRGALRRLHDRLHGCPIHREGISKGRRDRAQGRIRTLRAVLDELRQLERVHHERRQPVALRLLRARDLLGRLLCLARGLAQELDHRIGAPGLGRLRDELIHLGLHRSQLQPVTIFRALALALTALPLALALERFIPSCHLLPQRLHLIVARAVLGELRKHLPGLLLLRANRSFEHTQLVRFTLALGCNELVPQDCNFGILRRDSPVCFAHAAHLFAERGERLLVGETLLLQLLLVAPLQSLALQRRDAQLGGAHTILGFVPRGAVLLLRRGRLGREVGHPGVLLRAGWVRRDGTRRGPGGLRVPQRVAHGHLGRRLVGRKRDRGVRRRRHEGRKRHGCVGRGALREHLRVVVERPGHRDPVGVGDGRLVAPPAGQLGCDVAFELEDLLAREAGSRRRAVLERQVDRGLPAILQLLDPHSQRFEHRLQLGHVEVLLTLVGGGHALTLVAVHATVNSSFGKVLTLGVVAW